MTDPLAAKAVFHRQWVEQGACPAVHPDDREAWCALQAGHADADEPEPLHESGLLLRDGRPQRLTWADA